MTSLPTYGYGTGQISDRLADVLTNIPTYIPASDRLINMIDPHNDVLAEISTKPTDLHAYWPTGKVISTDRLADVLAGSPAYHNGRTINLLIGLQAYWVNYQWNDRLTDVVTNITDVLSQISTKWSTYRRTHQIINEITNVMIELPTYLLKLPTCWPNYRRSRRLTHLMVDLPTC